ncbi:hypothetical protein JHK85_011212 [Glycine max]|nr:hypothetical protein JHK85_011212 [Glycine max]
MKSGKLGILVLLVLFSSSTCSAWFGSKHKSSSGRSSFRPDEASSSSSSSSSSPYILNRFRAGSSVVFPVHGNVYPVGFYNVTLNIGQPPRPYFLDIDTGSDLTWLQCDAPCSRCSQTPHPLYRPSNDLVPCRHALCASLHLSDNYDCEVPHQCDYEVQYADHYSSLGVLLHDVYTLNFTNGVQLKVRMALGCGYDQIFPDPSHHPLDGMLGLGRGKTSLTSQLNSQGLLKKESGGKPLKEAHDDQTLPLCWRGRRPFRSIYEVRKYFKPIVLSFTSNGRNISMLNKVMVFDNDKQLIGWAPADCDQVPKSRDVSI